MNQITGAGWALFHCHWMGFVGAPCPDPRLRFNHQQLVFCVVPYPDHRSSVSSISPRWSLMEIQQRNFKRSDDEILEIRSGINPNNCVAINDPVRNWKLNASTECAAYRWQLKESSKTSHGNRGPTHAHTPHATVRHIAYSANYKCYMLIKLYLWFV